MVTGDSPWPLESDEVALPGDDEPGIVAGETPDRRIETEAARLRPEDGVGHDGRVADERNELACVVLPSPSGGRQWVTLDQPMPTRRPAEGEHMADPGVVARLS